MLTKLTVRNLKRFGKVEIELGNPVVFIGPNDSGKTTALQALALWEIGLRRWQEKREGKKTPEKRPGVTINRRDLIAVPVPDAVFLWRNCDVRNVERTPEGQQTKNIRVDIVVEGVGHGTSWTCGLEFDYANPESIYCRPLRRSEEKNPDRMPIPGQAAEVRTAFLPPMSGLTANETRLDPGAINVRLGEGRTAEVLRNLCHQIVSDKNNGNERWGDLRERIKDLFGVKIDAPRYDAGRGEVTMAYRDSSGITLDLSSSGRGMQQTLLLLAFLASHRQSVLLLDEPDAHLEILRQRQIYQVLSESAREYDSQIIAASHSEVVLNEAAGRDVVVAFIGKPHRIDDRGSQILKSLKNIGFEDYYQAEQTGWVLYLEGSTDLEILREFAQILDHPAKKHLERPFVHYVMNQPPKAYDHFFGLREAKPHLVGFAMFDRLDRTLEEKPGLWQVMWKRRELENYLCQRNTLLEWAKGKESPLLAKPSLEAMNKAIDEIADAMEKLGKDSPWSKDAKVSDDFLPPLFEAFYKKLNLPNLMQKSDYHQLARFVDKKDIDPDISQTLDHICQVAKHAKPLEETDEP